MKKYSVTKEVKFCAAHRLRGYEGACRNIHGHNYRVLVTMEREALEDAPEPLDRLGMVVDFGRIKQLIQEWLDDQWDHSLILHHDDGTLIMFAINSSMKYYIMDGNPTAENMASFLFDFIAGKLNDPDLSLLHIKDAPKVKSVRVYETDTSYAEVSDGISA